MLWHILVLLHPPTNVQQQHWTVSDSAKIRFFLDIPPFSIFKKKIITLSLNKLMRIMFVCFYSTKMRTINSLCEFSCTYTGTESVFVLTRRMWDWLVYLLQIKRIQTAVCTVESLVNQLWICGAAGHVLSFQSALQTQVEPYPLWVTLTLSDRELHWALLYRPLNNTSNPSGQKATASPRIWCIPHLLKLTTALFAVIARVAKSRDWGGEY